MMVRSFTAAAGVDSGNPSTSSTSRQVHVSYEDSNYNILIKSYLFFSQLSYNVLISTAGWCFVRIVAFRIAAVDSIVVVMVNKIAVVVMVVVMARS